MISVDVGQLKYYGDIGDVRPLAMLHTESDFTFNIFSDSSMSACACEQLGPFKVFQRKIYL